MRSVASHAFLLSAFLFPLSAHGLATPSRRQWLAQAITAVTIAGPVSSPSHASDELPLALRDYTKLAPLGERKVTSLHGKTTNLSLTELASRLEVDLSLGHSGEGGYFVSGDLDESIFRDDF